MTEPPPKSGREERLAAQLRANLRRRKEQARALRGGAMRPDREPPRDPSQSG